MIWESGRHSHQLTLCPITDSLLRSRERMNGMRPHILIECSATRGQSIPPEDVSIQPRRRDKDGGWHPTFDQFFHAFTHCTAVRVVNRYSHSWTPIALVVDPSSGATSATSRSNSR